MVNTTKMWEALTENRNRLKSLTKNEIIDELAIEGLLYFDIPEHFQTDLEIVTVAVANDTSSWGLVFAKLDRKFQCDRDIIIAALTNNGLVLRSLDPEFRDDEKLVRLAIDTHHEAYGSASERLRCDKHVLQLSLQKSAGVFEIKSLIKIIPTPLKSEIEQVLGFSISDPKTSVDTISSAVNQLLAMELHNKFRADHQASNKNTSARPPRL